MISTDSMNNAQILCEEYGDTIDIATSCVVGRVHMAIEGGRGQNTSATATLGLQNMIELRDHLTRLIDYAS